MKMTLTVGLILLLAITGFGQKPGAKSFGNSKKSTKNVRDELKFFPARGGKIDWGVAFSGGGIRSASFSIGILKALYDKGILDQVDVISSVSGGGYASYWSVMNSGRTFKRNKFGKGIFTNDRFVENICRLQNKADFLDQKKMIESALKDNSESFAIYENAILRTFGDPKLKERTISSLRPRIKNGELPYLIFNGTLEADEFGMAGRVFEMTPEYIGNPVLGNLVWKENKKRHLRLSEAVAISGAALKFRWSRKIENFAPQAFKSDELEISDGGSAENLAAFPLIRRGLENIVIVDAAHDPGYEFSHYRKLRKALFSLGIDFCVQGISDCSSEPDTKIEFSNQAVNFGYARTIPGKFKGKPFESRIYYLKMSRPASVFLPADYKPDDPAYKIERDRMKKGEKILRQRNGRTGTKNYRYQCQRIAGFRFDRDMYYYRVNSYKPVPSGVEKFLSDILPSRLRTGFPQQSTLDQKYDPEQLEAYIGLGFLQAQEIPDGSIKN